MLKLTFITTLVWSAIASSQPKKKVLLIGIDGMKPNVCIEQAKQDNSGFKRLREQGAWTF
jgi:hypothetical protein